MTGVLLDTNVVSEFRKGARADPGVLAWRKGLDPSTVWLSVLVLGELRRGIELLRRRDTRAAARLDAWFETLATDFEHRLLPVDAEVAERWGQLGVPDPVPPIDGLMAATALVHGLTLVTRNTADVAPTGVPVLNPFRAST